MAAGMVRASSGTSLLAKLAGFPRYTPAIVLALLVLPSRAHAYRTLSDTAEFAEADANSVVWEGAKLRYSLDDNLPAGLVPAQVEAAVVSAFGIWERVPCAAVTTSNEGWRRAPARSGDGISTISWVHDGWASGSEAGAHTDLVTKKRDGQWRIVEADVFLNAQDYTWTLDASAGSESKELRSILLHELGHVLGLAHPCTDASGSGCSDACGEAGVSECSTAQADVVMNPIYDSSRLTLAEDDEAALCALYPRKPCEQTECGDGFVCLDGDCLQACDEGLCKLGEVCTSSGCRPPVCDGGSCQVPCGRDTDCGVGETCGADGSCLVGKQAAGQPCSASADCELGVCDVNGTCRSACADDSSCQSGETCKPPAQEDTWGVCSGQRVPFGARCHVAEDCQSGQCVTGTKDGDVCTALCRSDDTCPAGWGCSSVDGKDVCTPIAPSGGCACTMYSVHGAAHAPVLSALLGLVALVAHRARRSKRMPRSLLASND